MDIEDDNEEITQLVGFDDDDLDITQIITPLEVAPAAASFEYEFEGVKIVFPYDAYDCQMEMMDKLIKGVTRKEHCLLESPTGTGKTAALLCALLAWQRNFNSDPPTPKKSKTEGIDSEDTSTEKTPIIYYATRTHSQIKQVVSQLAQTAYASVPMCILASRAQTCINASAFSQGTASVDETCQKFRDNLVLNAKRGSREETCKFYNQPSTLSEYLEKNRKPWDIEDVKQYGRTCKFCPYYELRKIQDSAKIIFCTYNHLLHKMISLSSKIDVKNNVVVFDEAHNIENVCLQIASTDPENPLSRKVDMVLVALATAGREPNIPSIKKQPLADLDLAFQRLWNWLHRFLKSDAQGFSEKSKYPPKEGADFYRSSQRSLTGDELVQQLNNIQFGPDHLPKIWGDYFILENKHFTVKISPDDDAFDFRVESSAMKCVANILFTLGMCFKRHPVTGDFINLLDYEIYIVRKILQTDSNRGQYAMVMNQVNNSPDSEASNNAKSTVNLKLICQNPAVIFKRMLSARTVIVTSGTLSPIASFASELDMKFPHVLSAKHILGPDKIFSCIIQRHENKDSISLNFSLRSRKDKEMEYHQQLFRILATICKRVNYGVLVFVPSRGFISELKDSWEDSGDIDKLNEIKNIYFEHEMRNADSFNNMLASYREDVKIPKGAILFAVLRGKVSEGVDFRDNQARAVVTIGIPFAPYKSDETVAKRHYNDKKNEMNSDYLSGWEWYNANAFRALNQAFGRCVRHSNDWGSIFIIDDRLATNSYKQSISKWVRDSLKASGRKTQGSLEDIFPHLNTFLSNIETSADQ